MEDSVDPSRVACFICGRVGRPVEHDAQRYHCPACEVVWYAGRLDLSWNRNLPFSRAVLPPRR